MAITDTKQAKDFTAGAPNITLKGDLTPTKMAMSDDANERALEQIFEQLLEEGFSPEEAAKRAREASARVNKERQDRKDANAKSAYKDRVTKGVRFYDKKGKGHIRDGKKVYS